MDGCVFCGWGVAECGGVDAWFAADLGEKTRVRVCELEEGEGRGDVFVDLETEFDGEAEETGDVWGGGKEEEIGKV